MAIRRIEILTEDTYGAEFMKRLTNKLKSLKIITKSINVKCERLAGKCYPKANRQIKAILGLKNIQKLIIIVDSEYENIQQVEEFVMKHVPNNYRSHVKVIVIDPKIEKWICIGLSIKIIGDPVETLKDYLRKKTGNVRGYEKHMLPQFVEKIEIIHLMQNSEFKKLLNALQDP